MEVAPTLYQAWIDLNRRFLLGDKDESFLVGGNQLSKGREFSSVAYNQTISGSGFGLPVDNPIVAPKRRINLLRGRYIDPPLWEEGITRLEERRKKGLGKQAPMSFVFQFHRPLRHDSPTGGGCLISLCFTWFYDTWKIHVMSRASEITVRLLGDMYFVDQLVKEILERVPVKHWPEAPSIDWTLLMASQMKHVVPFFLQITHGERFVKQLVTTEPKNMRVQGMTEYFWEFILHPYKITWAQRRKWSEKFMEFTEVDWAPLQKKYAPELVEVKKKK